MSDTPQTDAVINANRNDRGVYDELDRMTALALKLERQNTSLIKAGNALAAYIGPGPIPTAEPTERDYLLADWIEAGGAS